MSKTVVVYHSGYGHTQRLAQCVAAGAQAELVAIDADGNVSSAGWDALGAADAIVFGSPTYMGSVSWQFKKFADASSKVWYVQGWKDKLFGGFTTSSNLDGDKSSTLHYFLTLAMQHGGLWVGTGMCFHNTRQSQRDEVNYLASNIGPVAHTPGDVGAEGMNQGDLETARLFGERVLQQAGRLVAG